MMSDSKDIDIMYGLRAACVSGPASTNDALGVWHGNLKDIAGDLVQAAGEWCRIFKIENFIPHGIHFIP